MKKYLLILVIAFVSISIFAGIFGIEMGWSYEECEKAGAIIVVDSSPEGEVSSFFTPPETHTDFEIYVIEIDRDYGVYEIAALNRIEISDDGTEVKDGYETLKIQLTKTYGNPQELGGEEILCSSWMETKINSLSSIGLIASTDSINEGNVTLIYQSINYAKVMERLKAEAVSGL